MTRAFPNNRANEIIERVRISNVAEALGVKLDRTRRRGVATWRKGRNFSVSFDDAKNVWHDFVTGEGGGVLAFVERVRGSDRKAALQWLADFAGVPLQEMNEAEQRDYHRRRAVAECEAHRLTAWRDGLVGALRERRNLYLRAYHRARKYIQTRGLDSPAGELAADGHDIYEQRYQELDQEIDELLAKPWSELLLRFRAECESAT